MDNILYKNIIATVTYYDVLEYPLTSFEIWKYMIRYSGDNSQSMWSLSDVIIALKDENIVKYISQKNGMYFLFGRTNLVKLRRDREYISIIKMRKLLKIAAILRISPFVRMICVTGRLSYYNCDDQSDLDVLIVYKKGHIWTGRFMIAFLTQLLGVRRQDGKTNNRICLNYHITTESLRVPTQDIFAAHEYSFIIPVFDSGYFENFCKANNWIKKFKPNYECQKIEHELTFGDNVLITWCRNVLEFVLGDRAMENRMKTFQQNKINNNPKTSSDGALILCNDEHLVFLPQPHGPKVFEEYKRRFDTLEIDF